MARRQLVNAGVDIALVSKAGQTPNITGEAIAGIGAVLGEAFEKAQNKKKAVEEENKILSKILEGDREIPTFDTGDEEIVDPNDVTVYDENDLDLFPDEDFGAKIDIKKPITDPKNPKTQTYTYDMLGADAQAEYLKKNPNDIEGAKKYAADMVANAKTFNRKKYKTDNPTAEVAAVNNIVDPKFLENIYQPGTAVGKPTISTSTTFGSTGVANTIGKRYKDDSPIERRRFRGQRNLATVFGAAPASTSGLVGVTGVPSDSISRGETSQFTPGRTFVEKERRLSAPSWMGIGAAAIEGYNLGVEKRNYKKQVQADLQDYYEEEFAGLEVDQTGVDYIDQSIQGVMLEQKKKLAESLQEREKAFAEGNGAMWTAKHRELRKSPALVKNVVEKYKQLKEDISNGMIEDKYDFSAMPDEQADELLTIAKGGAPIGIADIEGAGLCFYGSTRGGMPYLKELNAFLGTGGPKAIEKQNAFDYVSEVVEDFRKNQDKYSKTVIDPKTKRKITVPMSMKELTPYLMRKFDAELDTESVIRAYASPSNWDEEGMTPEIFDASVQKGLDPRDFVKGKFLEAAQQMLTPYLSQYEETTTGESTAQFKAGIKESEQTKGKSQKEGLIDYMLSPEAFTFVPDKIVEGQTAIPELTTKAVEDFPGVKLFKGSSRVKDVDYNPQSGIMTIKPVGSVRVTGEDNVSVSTKEPIQVNFKQNPETLRLILSNLLQEFNITAVPPQAEAGKASQAISKFKQFEIQSN